MLKEGGQPFITGFNEAMQNNTFINFPFIGVTEDGEPFEYLFMGFKGENKENKEICVLDWFINRGKLHQGDIVELFLPDLQAPESISKNQGGVVIEIKSEEGIQGYTYNIAPSKLKKSFYLGNSFSEFLKDFPNADEKEFLIYLIKDCLILKQGIEVYLKHLIAYFSRIVSYSVKEYKNLKDIFFRDLMKQVQDKIIKLEIFLQLMREKLTKKEEIPIYIDLENIRELLQSEISLNLFQLMFTEESYQDIRSHLTVDSTTGFAMYINAIKNLEKRLYVNYNQIVMIYSKAMEIS